ncbi:hypothetical protein L7F22_062396 [Adiantum nelumboides]|nr:hypothetical protein [Adiantum nelumboides]
MASGSESGNLLHIKKLEGAHNYAIWKKQCYNVMLQKKQATPIKTEGNKPANMTDEEWEEVDELARSTIMLSVSDSLLFNVENEDTAWGKWKRLEDLYAQQSAASKVYWLKKLMDLRMEEGTQIALLSAFAEILWLVGGKTKAVVAVLDTGMLMPGDAGKEVEHDEAISQKLEGISLDSAMDLQKHIRICTYSSKSSLLHQLPTFLPVFRSRVGALLFLFSALFSRGLEAIQADRDDPGQPLVTAPFGHASQEIVNLLICGHAVPEVFDGNMDVGGGMTVKGIPSKVEVGFLTLLEAFKYCTVGQFLKRPKFPIWVVGSESHYTVLFALQSSIQDENELEDRERRIRQAFDSHDQSGGGGFIVASSMQQVLRDMNITMQQDMFENLCANEFVVWNELCQALHQIEKSKGGLKNTDAAGGSKHFEIYHFNGIAKTVGNSSSIQQRPRLTKLRVSVPPKWTPEEYMMDYKASASDKGTDAASSTDTSTEKPKEEPAQHAPIVDCIRTRWERATCNWVGDAPSIV